VIPRRIWVNLAAFALLFAWLGWWAVNNVIRLDIIEKPWRMSAEFDSAPGLRANVEVTYLGVRVGTIKDVSLDDGKVTVEMSIHKDTDLPDGVTADIRRKSAVGEPYISLAPPEGYRRGGPTIDHDAHHKIPIELTSVPLSYGELFVALDDLVEGVPGPALGTVLDELATALEGRGPALRKLLESGDDLSGTLAERTDVFDQLATNLTSLTHTIAAERGSIGSSFDSLEQITGVLAASRNDLDRLLREAPAFGQQVNALLQGSLDDLGCTFASTGELFDAIGDPERISELLRVLDVAEEADTAFNTAVIEAGDNGADGPYLTGSFGITADDPPPLYDPRPELPPVPALGTCGAQARAGTSPAGDRPVAPLGPDERIEGDHELAISPRPPAPSPDVPASSDAPVGDQRFPLTIAVLLAGLGLAAVALLTSRSRRPKTANVGVTDDDVDSADEVRT
jgi:phospholipid/cholesterol/gamma-HCH transport system substrate-binding protein